MHKETHNVLTEALFDLINKYFRDGADNNSILATCNDIDRHYARTPGTLWDEVLELENNTCDS